MKNKLFTFSLAVITALIPSCKDDKGAARAICSEGNTVKFPVDAVNRFYFKDSTFWIYQDSLSHQLDSVWVEQSNKDNFNSFRDHKLYTRCYQMCYYKLVSLLNGKTIVRLEPNGVSEDMNYTEEFFRVIYQPEVLGFSSIYRFNLDGNEFRKGNIDGDTIIFKDNIVVHSDLYRNVLCHINNPSKIEIYKSAWYSDSIGLIKYVSSNGSIWELLRYKIYK